jgi:hypothetical protein
LLPDPVQPKHFEGFACAPDRFFLAFSIERSAFFKVRHCNWDGAHHLIIPNGIIRFMTGTIRQLIENFIP